tara:strand:+ start:1474 stop:1875 length:402 start_codon:yes stop_codon:yes gene_type:complete
MNFVLYIVFISSYVLSGQDEKNWIIRSNVIDRASSIDTMGIIHDEADGKVLVSSKKRLIRIVATIGTILFSGQAWKIQQDADKEYELYLYTGNPKDRKDAWNKTIKLDKTSGWLMVGSQLFMQLLIYTYIDDS